MKLSVHSINVRNYGNLFLQRIIIIVQHWSNEILRGDFFCVDSTHYQVLTNIDMNFWIIAFNTYLGSVVSLHLLQPHNVAREVIQPMSDKISNLYKLGTCNFSPCPLITVPLLLHFKTYICPIVSILSPVPSSQIFLFLSSHAWTHDYMLRSALKDYHFMWIPKVSLSSELYLCFFISNKYIEFVHACLWIHEFVKFL